MGIPHNLWGEDERVYHHVLSTGSGVTHPIMVWTGVREGRRVHISPMCRVIQLSLFDLPGEAVEYLEVPANAGFYCFHYQNRQRLSTPSGFLHTSREGWSDAMAAKWLFLEATIR